jgi:hypothetical protein
LFIVWCFKKLESTAFPKLDLFPSLGEGWRKSNILGSLERATSITGQPVSSSSHIATDGQSISSSWSLSDNYFVSSSCRALLSDERTGL